MQEDKLLLDRYIRARYPMIVITSHEENRVMESIKEISEYRDREVVEWSITSGLVGGNFDESTADPIGMMEAILSPFKATKSDSPFDEDDQNSSENDYGISKPVMFVIKDFHNILMNGENNDPVLTRYIRDICSEFEIRRHSLIFLSPTFNIPHDLEKTGIVLDWSLPDNTEIYQIVTDCSNNLPSSVKIEMDEKTKEGICKALQGLSRFEATSCLLSSIAANAEMTMNIIPLIVEEKQQIVKKAGILEYISDYADMDKDVGGLRHLKTYAEMQRLSFTTEAQEYGVESPKGLIMVGIPGAGKSLMAKAIAGGKMPLLRMDIGALMGSLVGQSESNMRNALKTAEAVAPCALWIDEIEKALGGGGSERDGGTSMRVLGTLLTWMQEKKKPVYVIATANDVRSLKPELLRRFDDVIWADLPNINDRIEIFKVHLNKRDRFISDSKILSAAKLTRGYTGAEIEKVVNLSIKRAYMEGKEKNDLDLESSCKMVVPISLTMQEELEEIREWAKGRAIQANDPLEKQETMQKKVQKAPLIEL